MDTFKDEKEFPSHDTFLYDVNELCLEEKTITNGIAKYIDQEEKSNSKLMERVKDEFYPDPENFLFKADLDEDENENYEEAIVSSSPKYSSEKPDNVLLEAKREKGIFKPFVKKLPKNINKKKQKEKATVVAPGENQKFDNIFKFQEEKCFPTLFPKGTGGYASSYLETGLGFSNYCKLRLTGGICVNDKDIHEQIQKVEKDSCVDYERFRRDHHYMMFLLLVLDSINMRRAQETAFRKVTRLNKYTSDRTKVTETDRTLLERRNIGYRTFKGSQYKKVLNFFVKFHAVGDD